MTVLIGVLSQECGYTGDTEWTYTSSGIFTVPWTGEYCIEAVGAGGAGAAGDAFIGGGGGGGAGGETSDTVTLTRGAEIYVTVGAGGSSDGGTSSFGSYVIAYGGIAGNYPWSQPCPYDPELVTEYYGGSGGSSGSGEEGYAGSYSYNEGGGIGGAGGGSNGGSGGGNGYQSGAYPGGGGAGGDAYAPPDSGKDGRVKITLLLNGRGAVL